jgi:hypothetical protein
VRDVGLRDSDRAGGEGGDVGERAGAEHPHNPVEGDGDGEGGEEDGRDRGPAEPAEE